MKNVTILILPAILFLSFQGDKNISNGEFNVKLLEKSFVFVPGDTLFINTNNNNDNTYYDFEVESLYEKGKSHSIKINSFYLNKFEVSNSDYRLFMKGKAGNDSNLYKSLAPDTTVWRMEKAFMEPFVRLYFRHPSYADYPVVGVSYKQAQAYCDWLTQKYMSQEKRKYKKVTFQLPSIEEWMFASKGGYRYNIFPWSGLNMQNKKGQWMANFAVVMQWTAHRTKVKYKEADGKEVEKDMIIAGTSHFFSDNYSGYTTPVKSYWPNEYGIYNMAGNVEEYVNNEGITMGGSWLDPGSNLRIGHIERYSIQQSASSERGFRIMMKVIEE